MEKFVRVALKVALNDGLFTYRCPDAENHHPLIGKRVKVTLRNRPLTGVILDEVSEQFAQPNLKIKDILEVIDREPVITEKQLELMKFCAHYYFNGLGPCIHMGVPRNEKGPREKSPAKKAIKRQIDELSAEQMRVSEQILDNQAKAFLLEGVTGSGKTHVYIKVAEAVLLENRSVLFIVPEISLTPQLVKRVETALGIGALVMHSNITPAKKRDTIFQLLRREAKILIGARSAIFAPMPSLGLIVVDEEHDASFKQDESPRYHARDLALWRAKNEGARIILGSATPSLESTVNVQKGKLVHLALENRFLKDRPLPSVTIIDLKERAHDVDFRTQDQSKTSGQKICIISRPLMEQMKATLDQGAQVLLFLNQRGYAKFGVCYQCGHMVECPNCSVGVTYYHGRRLLMCHLCQHSEVAHTICRNCKNDAIKFLGLGTERLEEEVKELFPKAHVVRLDRDVVRSERRLLDTLNAMHEQRADILIGTQMVAKGHDFLHVGLVGVICADVALSMPDFRAAEKTFQTLTQVAGRAGRGHFLGVALIQTFNPEHQSIVCAKDHNVRGFLAAEINLRRRFNQPPFSRAALIRCEHKDKEIAESAIGHVSQILRHEKRAQILGPTPSPIERINGRFRFQCMVMAQEYGALHRALKRVTTDQELNTLVQKKHMRLIIDVDPHHLS